MKNVIAIVAFVLATIITATPVFADMEPGLYIDGSRYENESQGEGSKGGTWKWDGRSDLNLNDFKSEHPIINEGRSEDLIITATGNNSVEYIYSFGSDLDITGNGSLETASIQAGGVSITDTTVVINNDDNHSVGIYGGDNGVNIENSNVSINAEAKDFDKNDDDNTSQGVGIVSAGDVNIKNSNVNVRVSETEEDSKKDNDSNMTGIVGNNITIDNSNVKVKLDVPGVPITTKNQNSYMTDTTDGKISLIASSIKTNGAAVVDFENGGTKEQFIGKGEEGSFIINRDPCDIPEDRYTKEVEIRADDQSKVVANTDSLSKKTTNNEWASNAPITINDPSDIITNTNNFVRRTIENTMDSLMLEYHVSSKTKQFLDNIGKVSVNRTEIVNGRNYMNWARETNSIRPVEYAALCHIANDVGSDVGKRIINSNKNIETRSDLFYSLLTGKNIDNNFRNKYSFPEGHPLTSIAPENIFFFEDGEKGEVEGAVIALDEKSAIVVYCGTDPSESKIDVAADVDIFVGPTVGNALTMEVGISIDVIRKLQTRGFENIYVCGHSLGGYLAVTTAVMPAVKEIYALDAPGASKGTVSILNQFSDKINYIRNRGSGVSSIGMYVSDARQSEIELSGNKETNSAGPMFLSEHSIYSIKCSLGAPNMLESTDGDTWKNQWKKAIYASDKEYTMSLEPSWKGMTRYLGW